MLPFYASIAIDRILCRSEQIHKKLQTKESLQVRWHEQRFITFRYPAPDGYGVRGVLVGVYSKSACLEWIEEDLIAFAHSLSDNFKQIQDSCS